MADCREDTANSHLQVKTLCTLETKLSPDTIEWCPLSDLRSLMALGCYQLEKGEQGRRIGELVLYSVEPNVAATSTDCDAERDLEECAVDCYHLRAVGGVESHGILDMRWLPCAVNGCAVLATAESNGDVLLYSMEEEQGEAVVNVAQRCAVVKSGLCLSLDWNYCQGVPSQLSTSDSLGQVTILQADGGGLLKQTATYKAHEYEAWVTTFDCWDSNVLYSGGDDCQFCVWDLRAFDCGPHTRDKRTHQMGVCSIQSHPLLRHTLYTGSYDEMLRVWDTRSLARPVGEHATGGGVWRIKPHPIDPTLLLLVAMYNRFHVIKWDLKHSSMPMLVGMVGSPETQLCYGGAWQYKSCTDDKAHSLFSTCTFYDKQLTLAHLSHNS